MLTCQYCGNELKHYIGNDKILRCAYCLAPKTVSEITSDASADYQKSEHLRHLGRFTEAYEACRRSADGGNLSAAINLGYYYEYGLSSNGMVICNKDVKAAFHQYFTVAKLNEKVAAVFGIEHVRNNSDPATVMCALRNLICVLATEPSEFGDAVAQYPALYSGRKLDVAVDYCLKKLLDVYFESMGENVSSEDSSLYELRSKLSGRDFKAAEEESFPSTDVEFLIFFTRERLSDYSLDEFTEGVLLNKSLSMGAFEGIKPTQWAYIRNKLADAFNASKSAVLNLKLTLGFKRKKDVLLFKADVSFKPVIQQFYKAFLGDGFKAAMFTENDLKAQLTDVCLTAVRQKTYKNSRFTDKDKDVETAVRSALEEVIKPIIPAGTAVDITLKGDTLKI